MSRSPVPSSVVVALVMLTCVPAAATASVAQPANTRVLPSRSLSGLVALASPVRPCRPAASAPLPAVPTPSPGARVVLAPVGDPSAIWSFIPVDVLPGAAELESRPPPAPLKPTGRADALPR